ncbi:GNAT family N-acetyltransferase [Streptomyces sp. NBC_00631]|uniref:GNAT family N-acetyltransferase n=1 Tax=Streptomyces sp. NBC_00631 TaxID=2975793 RepID=UPI0030E332E5
MESVVGYPLDDFLASQTTLSAPHFQLVREALFDDLDHVNEMHARCSLDSRYARYGAARQALTPREWRRLCDQANGITVVAAPLHNPSRVIAVACLMRTSALHMRELGILVEDAWQGKGLGSILTRHMAALTRTRALDCQVITATTGSGNQRMLSILRGMGARMSPSRGGTVDALIRMKT